MIISPLLFVLLSVVSPVLALGNGFVLARLTARRRKSMAHNWDDETYEGIVAFITQRRDGARFEALSMASRWDTVRSGTAAVVWAELDALLLDLEAEREPLEEPRKEPKDDEPEGSGSPPR